MAEAADNDDDSGCSGDEAESNIVHEAGPRDGNGKLHGRCTQKWRNGSLFRGRYVFLLSSYLSRSYHVYRIYLD